MLARVRIPTYGARLMKHALALAFSIAMTQPLTTAHADPVDAIPLDPLRPTPSAGELSLEVARLSVVGSILYVAAHPDDENTRLLSWLVGSRGLTASYVSLTRGDGGQNLIGQELSALLGLIRTHELLAARRIDGARQYFTRAIDFGYSKTAEETMALWDAGEKDAVLSDLVRVVRHTRPDVIITRFSTEPPNHGHHIASALLARQAFTAAADPDRFHGQRQDGHNPHAAVRLFENKSHWRFKEGEDLGKYHQLDVGAFSPLIGRSFAELAAASRTMHKSQGFGSAPSHGPQPEYFELIESRDSGPRVVGDPFAGLDFTWRRFPGTEKVLATLETLNRTFDPRQPARSVPALVEVRKAIASLPAATDAGLVAFYRAEKLRAIDALLIDLTGLFLDARSPSPEVIPHAVGKVTFVAWPRSGGEVELTAVRWPDGRNEDVKKALGPTPLKLETDYRVAPDQPWSTPFWLRSARKGHLFDVPGYQGIHPQGPADVSLTASLKVSGQRVDVVVPVRQSWVDPVHGERFRPVEVLPPVTLTPTRPTLMLANGKPGKLAVRVVAHGGAATGEVSIKAPEGWKVSGVGAFTLDKGGESELVFEVTAPVSRDASRNDTQRVPLTLTARVGGTEVSVQRRVIDHPHIPTTTVLSESAVTAVVFPFAPGLKRIGYVVGPGDEVMGSLVSVGYEVTALPVEQLAREDLAKFDAIVVGVRAFNQEPALVHQHKRLMDYVKNGGTYLVQYQVSSRFRPLGEIPIGPASFSIAQGRVTDERAAIKALDPKIMAGPNRLGNQDFEGWVQERGLYFAEKWDKSYVPLFEMADPNESPQQGSTLAVRHGKGAFIYTGLSFFRQLPEGVPGAYRLFANLLSWSRAK